MANPWSTTLDDVAPPAPRRRRALRAASALVVMILVVGGAQKGLASPGQDVGGPVGPVPDDAREVEVPAEHAAAIAAYWRDRDAAFSRSGEAGATFVASRLHPALGYREDNCMRAWFPEGVPERLRQRVTLHDDTVVPDPDWRMPHGPLHDTALRDPVYRMHVNVTLSGLPSNVDVDQTVAVRLAVIGGRAYGFAACVEPTVARTIIDQLAAQAGVAVTFGHVPDPSGTPPSSAAPSPTPGVSLVRPAPTPRPSPHIDPSATPTDAAPLVPLPPRTTLPDPPSSPRTPWPTFPPREWPGTTDPPSGPELTLEEELFLALVLIDWLLHIDLLSVAEAIELLALLAAAPELDDDHRALVERYLELLRDYHDDPRGDPPRVFPQRDPETGDVVMASAGAEPPDGWEARERAIRVGCALSLDVMDAYRTSCE